jgi:hypothetical protein
MMRRLLITSGLALTLVLLNGGAAGARDSRRPPPLPTTSALSAATTTSSGTPLLPGEATWSSGAPSFDFGTNDTVDYAEPSVNELPSVQADLKAGGLTLMRVWGYSGNIGSTPLQRAQVAQNSGMTCMFMLGSTQSLSWLENTVNTVKSYCPYFEFGNEPSDLTAYTKQWITMIPKLRAIDPTGLFGGPAFFYTYVSYFLQQTKAAGVLPDFITWHDYPCEAYTSQSKCLADTVTKFTADQDGALAAEQQILGYTLPTGVSEYNFDAGSGTLGAWGDNANFMTSFTNTAIDTFVKDGFSFACQFTTLNYSGYGYLDMFSDSPPYGPKPQFTAMAAEVTKYHSLSTKVLVPSNGSALKGTAAVLDAAAAGASPVTGVTFDLSGGSLPKPVVVGTAIPTLYGWIAFWNTTTVANGTYSLQSVATDTGGTTATSPKITVTVSN